MNKPPAKPVIAGAIALAVAAVVPFTTSFEGVKLHAYKDPAGIPTECTGETQNVQWGVTFTHAQCQAMLKKRLTNDYAPGVLKCVPSLADHPSAFEAALDAGYNAGPPGFCRSPMAREFNEGRWAEGCAAFIGWRVTARGQVFAGLVRRRQAEAALCAKGL